MVGCPIALGDNGAVGAGMAWGASYGAMKVTRDDWGDGPKSTMEYLEDAIRTAASLGDRIIVMAYSRAYDVRA